MSEDERAVARRVAFIHASAWYDLGVGEPPTDTEVRLLVGWLDDCRYMLAKVLDVAETSSDVRNLVRACRMGEPIENEAPTDWEDISDAFRTIQAQRKKDAEKGTT